MKPSCQIVVVFLALSLSSCVSYNSLLNYKQAPLIPTEAQIISNFKPIRIQTNDLLQIQVSSTDPESVQPFGIGGGADNAGASSYLVNSDGFIDFPTLGAIEVKGLAIEEAKNKIIDLLSPYFRQKPIVQLRLLNFRINVNGEVGSPGSFSSPNTRMTIVEALTRAGDFTSYSRRDSILIIREQEGMRSFGYVNFNSAELFDSPYFYLQQNDVIYVQPAKTKVNSIRDPSARFLPWISALVSISALVITITR